jgi:DNA-binding IclR family transcriptional regulator
VSRVQSIERAFAVLGALADGPIGVTEVAERAALPKSTAARLLRSLAREGAVEQVPGDTRYRLGPRMTALAASAVPGGSIVTIARPFLEALAAEVGEAVGLSVPDGPDVRYVDQVSVAHEVQVRDWTGTRAPMHSVPSGLVFLAELPEPTLRAFLAQPLEALTAHTVTDRDAIRHRLATVRRDGYGWVRDEFADGISSVVAPIRDAAGVAVAALHVHGPSYRFPRRAAEDEAARQVVATAARISARLRPAPSRPAG